MLVGGGDGFLVGWMDPSRRTNRCVRLRAVRCGATVWNLADLIRNRNVSVSNSRFHEVHKCHRNVLDGWMDGWMIFQVPRSVGVGSSRHCTDVYGKAPCLWLVRVSVCCDTPILPTALSLLTNNPTEEERIVIQEQSHTLEQQQQPQVH